MERNHGHIVTLSSASSQGGVAGLCDYAASKFAVFGMDESLRMELKKKGKTGVHTTCVCPYYINTGALLDVMVVVGMEEQYGSRCPWPSSRMPPLSFSFPATPQACSKVYTLASVGCFPFSNPNM
jgi:NAD(P)-dependent dehydrogenase (short-subunit alcohol dehydrogenase family)